jgi:hypothetical protein
MRRLSLIRCVGLFLLMAGPALAQAPSPDAMSAARELMLVTKSIEMVKSILPAVANNLKPAVVQGRPEVDRAYDTILPIVMESMSDRMDKAVDEIAALYASNFSAQELRELAAFYRSPTGQKLVEKQPLIAKESMAIGQKFGQAVAKEIQGRIVEELRKAGIKN